MPMNTPPDEDINMLDVVQQYSHALDLPDD